MGHDHAEVCSGVTGSSALVYDTIRRRAMDSRSKCRGTAEAGLRRRVFRMCASKLASDESLGYQHMGAVYHRVRNRIASTSESHGGDLIIQRYDRSGWRVVLLKCSHSLKGARQVRG
ncbi:hypothetical protein GW17_00018802 [Ensete ventricosum]|nr:hypothetical protein GW17_00018802 [Ensete ventricosum]